MLTEAVQTALAAQALVSRADFRPFPAFADRAAWQALDARARAHYEALKGDFLRRSYPLLPAARYMDFTFNGDRSRYEDLYFERRTALYVFLVAGGMFGEADVLDALIDLVWAICEESSWVIPAHNNKSPLTRHPQPIALPDVEEDMPYVDLFSAETASILAWIVYFFRDKLNAVSPLIVRRVELEIERRVLTPFLRRNDMRWMGFADDEPVNNWNPWINSNVLAAALVMETDEARRQAIVLRSARSLDRFLSFYPADGGCDEGPAYFRVAGGSLMDCLELIDLATRGAASIYDHPLIHNIARYIMNAHIRGRYFTNFADAASVVQPDALLLRRAACRMGLDDLKGFAEGLLAEGSAALPYAHQYDLAFRRLRNLFDYRPAEYGAARVTHALSHAFPGIQVGMARENADGSGLYFAAKGGCNGESHNHNDIGNFIVYLDGIPALCDAGVETYRRETFSEERYSIWTMQSRYHNTAIIGGNDQLPGSAYAGRDFSFADTGDECVFSLDMAPAYGAFVGVRVYRRVITLDRVGHIITVTDEGLFSAPRSLTLPLMCAREPVLSPGLIRVPVHEGALSVEYDAALFSASCEAIPIPDPRLQASWQRPALYRVLLTRRACQAEYRHQLRIHA